MHRGKYFHPYPYLQALKSIFRSDLNRISVADTIGPWSLAPLDPGLGSMWTHFGYEECTVLLNKNKGLFLNKNNVLFLSKNNVLLLNKIDVLSLNKDNVLAFE